MIRVLDRKLLRDIWHLRGQVAAIAVVAACGVAVVVTTRTSYTSLLVSRATYYEQYRFADIFAPLKRAPEAVLNRLGAIPGVREAESRVVAEVSLDVPGLSEPAIGRLVSIPESGRPLLNDLHLRSGRWPEPGRRDEVIISDAFARANSLRAGDSLGAVLNGRWQRLRIVGLAVSPEYVYEVPAGGIFPDNRRFGVIWMRREALGSAFDLLGAFNDVSLALVPGASEAEVISRIDRILSRYGGLGAYGRRDQASARFLDNEIEENRVSGTIVPALFLGIAAFLLNVVLARLVSMEREQVAVLKAFGYTNRTVGWHYLKLALVMLGLGTVAGIGLGLWFASAVTDLYAQYFQFPALLFRIDGVALIGAVTVSVLAAVLGAAGAVRRVVSLTPAQAMMPPSPGRFRLGRFGRLPWLGISGRLVARNLERRPLRATFSVLGIALATSTMVLGWYFIDAIWFMANVQFKHVQQENVTVVFSRPRPGAVAYELAGLPGVLRAEPFRFVPVRLRSGHLSRRTALMGLPEDGQLHRLLDRDLTPVALPTEGLLLSSKLAEILGVKPGDPVTVEVLEGKRLVRQVPVAATVDELIGLSAYMNRVALDRLLGEGPTVTGALLRTDPLESGQLFARLKRLPGVAGVTSHDATVASFEATIAESFGIVSTVLIGFAGALAVAIVYNTARIALSERARELASLRVLGFTRAEIGLMLLGEQALLAGLGIVAGLGAGYGFAALISGLYQWELFRFPLEISTRTYVQSAGVVMLAALASGIVVRHRLNRLDLVAVLKTRE
ncbi:MAG TPA: ABC transporter permease [Gemmatimonadales bacterium]